MSTLADVAKKANVSQMTVSRVINHPQEVSEGLKQLVYAAMDALHYRPNAAAKALANNRTQVVKLLILEDIKTTEPYYMNLLFGIAQGLNQRQYALQLLTKRNVDLGAADGYIVTGARNGDDAWLAQLKKPLVVFGENRSGYDYVDTDNKLGTQMATNYALDKNYQSLIFIGIDAKAAFEYSREAGYINTMQEHEQRPRIQRMANHSHLSEQFINEAWPHLARNTAFICASDRLALGVVRALMAHGAKLPNDFGVFGFDGVFLDQVSNPQLATVKQPIQQLGVLCAQMLLQKIDQNGAPQGERLVPPKLVIRGTMRQ